MLQEFVCSIYILSEKGILLLKHQRLGKWLPPGGHVETGELPFEAALREAKEETGLDVELIHSNPIELNYPNAKSLPSSYLTLWHPELLPCPHEHINFVFLAKPIGGFLQRNQESSDLKWFSLEDMQEIAKEDIFADTIDVMQHLFARMDLFPQKIEQGACNE